MHWSAKPMPEKRICHICARSLTNYVKFEKVIKFCLHLTFPDLPSNIAYIPMPSKENFGNLRSDLIRSLQNRITCFMFILC